MSRIKAVCDVDRQVAPFLPEEHAAPAAIDVKAMRGDLQIIGGVQGECGESQRRGKFWAGGYQHTDIAGMRYSCHRNASCS